MKKFHLIFSHNLTNEQIEDAKKTFSIEEIVPLPWELKQLWSNIPPQMGDISTYLDPLFVYMRSEIRSGDIALIQGDFGATYKAVTIAKKLNAIAIYATTKREVKEKLVENRVIKESIFRHERFRLYE